jgi:hypothetical protein
MNDPTPSAWRALMTPSCWSLHPRPPQHDRRNLTQTRQYRAFRLKCNPDYNSICNLWWHQYRQCTRFCLLRRTCRTALQQIQVAIWKRRHVRSFIRTVRNEIRYRYTSPATCNTIMYLHAHRSVESSSRLTFERFTIEPSTKQSPWKATSRSVNQKIPRLL